MKMKEHEIVNDPSEIILPHEQYQQKTECFIDVFHEPFEHWSEGWRENQDDLHVNEESKLSLLKNLQVMHIFSFNNLNLKIAYQKNAPKVLVDILKFLKSSENKN